MMGLTYHLSARIDQYADEIDRRNRENFLLFSKGAVPLAGIIFVISLPLPDSYGLYLVPGILFLYACLLFYLARICFQREVKQIRAIQYLAWAPLFLGGILVGTFLDPTKQAVTILIFICVLPMFITDKLWRIILYQLAFTVLFILCSYAAKPFNVFFADIVYLPIYLFVIMGANVFSLIEKVERAENYVMLGYESEHDPLTGLLNRRAGEKRVRTLLQNKVAGIFAVIDIDDFKSFNDNCGHQAGDDVLCALGKTMLSVAGKDDVIWRLGGDEFAVYMVNILDSDVCRQRFDAVMEKLKNTKAAQYESLNVRISVGGTLCKDANCDFENMYRMSDAALYESKNTGKGKVIIRTQGTY